MRSRLVTEPEVLSHSYLPEALHFRQKERAQLLALLCKGVNTLVYAPVGSGKTTLLKSVIEAFNTSSTSKAIYVDGTLYQTANSIVKELLSFLSPVSAIPKSTSLLLDRLKGRAERIRLIACIDHFQWVIEVSAVDKLLSLPISALVLVSDNHAPFRRLSNSARAKMANFLRIPKYTLFQTHRILMDRAENALAENSWDDWLIQKIADRCDGNITLGLSLLRASATQAESQKRRRIKETDIPTDIFQEPSLRNDEQLLFEIVKKGKRLPASELYRIYRETAEHPKSERSFREYMHRLALKGLVKAIGEKRWRVYEFCAD